MFRFSVFFLVGGEFQSVNVWIMSEKLFSDGELNKKTTEEKKSRPDEWVKKKEL